MSILSNLKKLFRKKDEKEIVKQLAEAYHAKKEKGEEHPVDTTISKIMEIINQSENPDETAQRILTAALDDKKMPDRIPEKLSIEISKSDDISDSVIGKAVEESNYNVPDEMIDKIIEEGSVNQSVRLKLIKNVDDENILKDRIESEFMDLYNKCKDQRDDEVVSRIQEIKQILSDSDIEMNSSELIEKVVSKKMAENTYNDIMKGTRVYTLSQIYPVSKMFERNIENKVESEYKKIEEERGIKEGRFNKGRLRIQILREIARNTGYKYRQSGVMYVPQSENMKKISQEEEEVFISTVETASKKEFDDKDKSEIKEQIRGVIRNKETKEAMLLEAIKEMPNQDKYLDLIANIVDDEDKLITLSMADESGMLDQLAIIPIDVRKKAMTTIGDTIKNRREQRLAKEEKENNSEEIDNEER